MNTKYTEYLHKFEKSTPIAKHLLWNLYLIDNVHYLTFYERESDPSFITKIFIGYVGIILKYDEVLEKNNYKMRTHSISGDPDKDRFICHNENDPAIIFPDDRHGGYFLDGVNVEYSSIENFRNKKELKKKIQNL